MHPVITFKSLTILCISRSRMALRFWRTFSTFRALRRGGATMNSIDLPEIFLPPVNRSMRELDRSFFQKKVPISAAAVLDARRIQKARAALTQSNEVLPLQSRRVIIDDVNQPGVKLILLNPEVKRDQPERWSTALSQLVADNVVQIQPYDLTLTYDDWSMHNILLAILPDPSDANQEIPTGFAQAGHIAHLNLREQHLPYQKLIGQVLLDKNQPVIKTVINKTLDVGSESVFRTFPYEVIAGEKDLQVTVSEQGCEFHFNFAEVYWNSRLGTEHERVVKRFRTGEAVCDVMAGVGPFAIPAGKNGVFVRANDLNPRSFQGLEWAIDHNKVQGVVSASCMDGREFIRQETRKLLEQRRSLTMAPKLKISRNASKEELEDLKDRRRRLTVTINEPSSFDHYVMNLPASAVEFLDAFKGVMHGRELEFAPHTDRKLPMVHVYTFQAKRETGEEEVREVCEKVSLHLGAEIKATSEEVEIFDVRLVAPNKRMFCASFRLPPAVAFANGYTT